MVLRVWQGMAFSGEVWYQDQTRLGGITPRWEDPPSFNNSAFDIFYPSNTDNSISAVPLRWKSESEILFCMEDSAKQLNHIDFVVFRRASVSSTWPWQSISLIFMFPLYQLFAKCNRLACLLSFAIVFVGLLQRQFHLWIWNFLAPNNCWEALCTS